MSILLANSPTLHPDWYWIAGTATVLVICYFYLRYVRKAQQERARKNHDPRSHIVNETNYNLNRRGIEGHRTEANSSEEAAIIIERMKNSGTIPTPKEFHALRQDLRKS